RWRRRGRRGGARRELVDVGLDLSALAGRETGRLAQVLLESVDGLLVATVLLVAAPLVIDVRRVVRSCVELGEQLNAAVGVLAEAGLFRFDLALDLALIGLLGGGAWHCCRAGEHGK